MSKAAPLETAPLAEIAEDLLARAKRAGAHAAEAAVSESRSLEVGVRQGALEELERSETREAGLRVLIGKRQAGVAFSDLSPEGCAHAVERAIAMARIAPEDPYCGLLEAGQLAGALTHPPTYEDGAWETEALLDQALALEAAALAVPGVDQVASAGASASASASAVSASNGFSGARKGSRWSLGVSAIAKRNGAMERDYDSDSVRRRGDLKSAQEIGRTAGERAVARLGADQMATGKAPVVFDRRVAGAFVSYFLSAISGPSIARGSSFLRDKLGEQVFAEGLAVIEDPTLPWGHASRAYDGEGAPVRKRALIDDGVVTTWLLNAASARQLGLEITGHAARRLGAPPGVAPTNIHLEAGPQSRAALIAEAKDGLLVTEMFGPSLNSNTGDWSVGVSGFQIVSGEIGPPVSEITVAGNLLDLFPRLIPGDDLEMRRSLNAPSVYVDALSIGGR